MMTEYQDIDVQDKARFYYALLTGAADKKVNNMIKLCHRLIKEQVINLIKNIEVISLSASCDIHPW